MILLDTHVVVMLVLKPDRLSKPAERAIGRAAAKRALAIASITLWELAWLIARERVRVQGSSEAFLNEICERPGFKVLEITPEIALLSAQFPQDFSKDPADRLIAATARAHGLSLVTKDESMRQSPLIRTIW